jgi:HD-GYP domain-containing protein (c-di-GMP phosphodiesterase class II)
VSGALELVGALSTARRAVQLYPPAHPSYAEAIEGVVRAVRACSAAEGGFVLNLHEGRLYEGSQVIGGDAPALSALALSMERHRVESLALDPAFSAGDAVALSEVFNLRPGPGIKVADELERRGVTTVVVGVLGDADEDGERKERDLKREKDRALYRQLIMVLRVIHQEVVATGSPNLDQAENMVGDIMSRLVEDDAAVLGMATLNTHDEGALFHSINVMIYTLTLGLGLGLPEDGLMGLGIAALLHDVGKAAFDLDDPEQAKVAVLMHPKVGAEVLARLPEEDPASMLVAFEHHMGSDGSGWPERPADYVTHPFSRMVAIADRYENLTKRGAGGADALTPDRAVMELLREAGRMLDPLFTRLFVRSLGVFPIGCVVRLSDSAVGVVAAKTDDVLSPRVRVLFDPNGVEPEEAYEVDLTQDPRSIVEVVDPEALDLTVSDHL